MALGSLDDVLRTITEGKAFLDRGRRERQANAAGVRGTTSARERALMGGDSAERLTRQAVAAMRAGRGMPPRESEVRNNRYGQEALARSRVASSVAPRRVGEAVNAWRGNAGATNVGVVDDQEGRYQLARANNAATFDRQGAVGDTLRESLGFGGEYPIGLGQTEDGKYAGFATQAMMQAAVRGRGEALRGEGAYLSGEATRLADELEHDVNYRALRERAGIVDDIKATGLMGEDRQAYDDEMYGDYRRQLDDWRASEMGRVGDARRVADEAAAIAPYEWARLAAERDYGLDPNVAAGMFDPSLDAKVTKAERDSAAIAATGLPYTEMMAAQEDEKKAAERDAAEQSKMSEEEYAAAQDDYVFQNTGINGSDFAQAVDLTPDQLITYIDSPEYGTYRQQIEDSAGDEPTLAAIAAELQAYDPTMWRILDTQYELPAPDYEALNG